MIVNHGEGRFDVDAPQLPAVGNQRSGKADDPPILGNMKIGVIRRDWFVVRIMIRRGPLNDDHDLTAGEGTKQILVLLRVGPLDVAGHVAGHDLGILVAQQENVDLDVALLANGPDSIHMGLHGRDVAGEQRGQDARLQHVQHQAALVLDFERGGLLEGAQRIDLQQQRGGHHEHRYGGQLLQAERMPGPHDRQGGLGSRRRFPGLERIAVHAVLLPAPENHGNRGMAGPASQSDIDNAGSGSSVGSWKTPPEVRSVGGRYRRRRFPRCGC